MGTDEKDATKALTRTDADNSAAIQAFCSLAGIDLTPERLEALVGQAEAHFGLLDVVRHQDPGQNEPAAEFRLDLERGDQR